jgi:hypothetical protein
MGKYRARVENLRTPIDVLVNLTRKYTHVPPSVLAKLSTVKTVDDIVKLFDSIFDTLNKLFPFDPMLTDNLIDYLFDVRIIEGSR